MSAQSKGGAANAERGWGSSWTEPANEQEHKRQELFNKIVAANQAHQTPTALALCDQLAAMMPNSFVPETARALAHLQVKQYDLALSDLDRARAFAQKAKQADADAHILVLRARVHELQEKYGAAVDDLQAALKLDAKNQTALNNFAWLRATALDAAFRNGLEGIRLAQKAVDLTTENSYIPIDTLAAAYAEANDYTRAVESEKRAQAAAGKEIKDVAKAQKFQKESGLRLRLFEQHQAYHGPLQ